MRAQLLHLSGPLRGRTATYRQSALRVGSASDADLRLPSLAARHATIEYRAEDCSFYLRAQEGPVFVNRAEVEEVILGDGDLIEWGVDGPRSRFRAYFPAGAACKPVRRMLADMRDVGSFSGPVAATGGFVRDLLTQATIQLKVGFPLFVLAAALPLAWIAGRLGGHAPAAALRADAVTQAEIEGLRDELQRQSAELQRLRAQSAVFQEIQRRWSRGVCLVHGVVGMRGQDGAWVTDRYGAPLQSEYTGSGFLCTAAGLVLTNRHVVTPWEFMPELQKAAAAGGVPEFVALTATFPGGLPIAVDPASIRRRTDTLDVALFRVAPASVADVPPLPLGAPAAPPADERAIVVGYPTGLAALLAKATAALVDRLRAQGADMTTVIAELAAADCISPMITQGTIGNVQPTMLVYDAPTTHGGSGGPVFGGDGKVLAVNYAVLRDFSGANFGVPIRYGQELVDEEEGR